MKMIDIGVLKEKPILFRRQVGMMPDQFDKLLKQIEPTYREYEIYRLKKNNPIRINKMGGGNPFKNSLEYRLLMVMMYYRMYDTQEFLGTLFGVHNSTVNRTIKAFNIIFARFFKVPENKVKPNIMRLDVEKMTDEERENLTDKDIHYLFIDGTEQRVQRPKKHQANYYSGKKKPI